MYLQSLLALLKTTSPFSLVSLTRTLPEDWCLHPSFLNLRINNSETCTAFYTLPSECTPIMADPHVIYYPD